MPGSLMVIVSTPLAFYERAKAFLLDIAWEYA